MQKQGAIVTIEIGDRYLKMVLCKVIKDKKNVIAAKIQSDPTLSDEGIVSSIKGFMASQHIKKAQVINCIPSTFGIFKNIEIPSVDKKEIKQIIDLQAGAHTPYPKNEIILDYEEVGVLHGRYTKILLVIVKRDVVTKRYDLIKGAGFRADTAVLAPEVASKLFFELCPHTGDKPIGVVHVDARFADFTIVQNGKSIYIRSISVGANDIESKGDETKKAFVEELKKSLEAYQANNIGDIPSQVYITGAIGRLSDIAAGAQEAMGLEVKLMPYPNLISLPKDMLGLIETNTAISLFSTIAPPLVSDTSNLSLIPEDIKIKREIKKKSKDVARMGILCMVLLVVFCAVFITDIFFKNMYLKKLSSSYSEENKEVERLGEISRIMGTMKRFLNKKGESLSVLSELFDSMPKEVYLSSFVFKKGDTLTFTGTADSMSRVFSLVTELENNSFFKNVKVDFTKSRRQEDKELADFGLTLLLEEKE